MTEQEPRPDLTFNQMLEAKWDEDKFVCVGLDSDYLKIPDEYIESDENIGVNIVNFNRSIVDATIDVASVYKPNFAFYEKCLKNGGLEALIETVRYIKRLDPSMPVILDAKRADIGNTNDGSVIMAFDQVGADAITVNPYLGSKAMEPFLARKNKGIIVLARTSNDGAEEFQDQIIIDAETGNIKGPLWKVVAETVRDVWNYNGNCGVVAGATYPEELAEIRTVVGDMPLLIPGVGAQGGGVADAVRNGRNSLGTGMIINSSRGIIFPAIPEDYTHEETVRAATLELHNEVKQAKLALAA